MRVALRLVADESVFCSRYSPVDSTSSQLMYSKWTKCGVLGGPNFQREGSVTFESMTSGSTTIGRSLSSVLWTDTTSVLPDELIETDTGSPSASCALGGRIVARAVPSRMTRIMRVPRGPWTRCAPRGMFQMEVEAPGAADRPQLRVQIEAGWCRPDQGVSVGLRVAVEHARSVENAFGALERGALRAHRCNRDAASRHLHAAAQLPRYPQRDV